MAAISVMVFPSARSKPSRIRDFSGSRYPLATCMAVWLETSLSGTSPHALDYGDLVVIQHIFNGIVK